MKASRTILALTAFAGVLALVAREAVSQDAPAAEEKSASPAERKMIMPTPEEMARAQKVAAPGEAHDTLKKLVGKWDVTMKVYMGEPGSTAMESAGESEFRLVMGGRFLLEELKATLMGMPFEGLGITGYDNYQNLYVGSWIDNMNTHLLTMKGSRDFHTGKTLTMYGTMSEPMLRIADRMVKYVSKWKSDDAFTLEIYDLHVDESYKVLEVDYARQ